MRDPCGDVSIAGQRDVRAMIKEFLLHLPFREKGRFLWLFGVCAIMWVFGGREMIEFLEGRIGTLVRFHVSLRFWFQFRSCFVAMH